MSLLAIGWEPELRGLLTTIIGVVVLMGSVYMIMATNMGSRLAFLVALTGLAGWMVLMGLTWWIYGIGLRGPDPSWQPVAGQTLLQDVGALRSAGVLERTPEVVDGDPAATSAAVQESLLAEDFFRVDPSDPAYGQAQAAASEFIEDGDIFAAGQYAITNVYEVGGERYPLIAGNESLDFFAFFHNARYALVEAAPLEAVREEPGRAPAIAGVDDTQPRQYVYMVRDLGARRQPAAVLTIGGSAVFLALCYLLHRRERILAENLSAAGAVAKA